MPDPKHLPTGNPQTDELLDPATLQTGIRFDEVERSHFLTALANMGKRVTADALYNTPPPKPQPVTILYPFLFAAMPAWTYGLQGRGDCMAWSSCLALDLLAAIDLELRKLTPQWPGLTSIEAQYGFMRVEAFGGKPDFSGDGASPTSAARAALNCGHLHRAKYLDDKYDLTRYDPSGGRSGQYGRYGVPDALEPIAKSHRCTDAILVTSYDQAVKLLQNAYPISNAAPDNPIYRRRDAAGYGLDAWNASHAMNYIGYRSTPRPALLKVNWGHGRHVVGPKWPDDMPDTLAACSAWEEQGAVERVLEQQWSWAYALDADFPQRQLPRAASNLEEIRPIFA
jgi:hypothetical protein